MNNKEKFRGLCQDVLPLINGIAEAVKRNGYETMASLTIGGDDYFAFSIHGSDWKMGKVNGGPVNMCYEFKEEIQLQDQRQEKMTYNKASENLVEISLVYAGLQAKNEVLSSVDGITWKQLFVQWANDFEAEQAGADWNQEDYLEKIGKFARRKILEYVELENLKKKARQRNRENSITTTGSTW